MSGLFSHVHDATVRVLGENGARVTSVRDQQCCGALHAHSGQRDDAVVLARANVRAFRSLPDDTTIVVNSAGCGALLKEYGRLLEGDPLEREATAFSNRVRDVSEVLDDIEKLTRASVQILACGTCLDFYGLKDKIKVGEITNAYTISETLLEAGKVVRF